MWNPGIVIDSIIHHLSCLGKVQWLESINHNGIFLGAFVAYTLFNGSRMRSVWNVSWMMGYTCIFNSFPAHKISLNIIKNFVGIYIRVIIWGRDSTHPIQPHRKGGAHMYNDASFPVFLCEFMVNHVYFLILGYEISPDACAHNSSLLVINIEVLFQYRKKVGKCYSFAASFCIEHTLICLCSNQILSFHQKILYTLPS